MGKDGGNPDDTEEADAQADDDHRTHRVSYAAEHGGEHLHQHPGEIIGDEIGHDGVGGLHHGLIRGQQPEQRDGREHQQGADAEGDGESHDQALTHALLDPVGKPGAMILGDEAGDGRAHGIADGPVEAVRLSAHGPGCYHNGAQGVDRHLDDHVGNAVHHVLQSGGNPQTEHVFEIHSLDAQIPEGEAVFLVPPGQLPGEECGVDNLGSHRGDGHTGNAPAQHDHKQGVQNDVGHAAGDHVQEGMEGIPQGPQNAGFHIQKHDAGNAEKVDPQIEDGALQGLLRRVQHTQHPGGGNKAEDHQGEAEEGEGGDPAAHGPAQILPAAGSEDLADDDGSPGGHGDKKAHQHIDNLGGAAAYRREGVGAHKPAYDQAVHRVIQLLEDGSGGDGKEEDEQLFPDAARGQIISRIRFTHIVQTSVRKTPRRPPPVF